MKTYLCPLFVVIFLNILGCKPEYKAPSRPNIVLILIDDLSIYGVSAYGAERITSLEGEFGPTKVTTPQIDKLAEEGVMCSNAHTYPLCENTRVALMSGKNNNRNFLNCKVQHASDITFSDIFSKEGYATGIFGKWKQTRGTQEIPGEKYISEFGWDEYCCFDVTREGQRFINPYLVINGKFANYRDSSAFDPQTGRRWYGPDICNRYALNFIDDHKNQEFFLYYPMLLVHDEHKPTPDTKPDSLFHYFDQANHNRNGHSGDNKKYFPDMIKYMDKLIGNIISKLEEHGLRENTLIVIMGDNGTKECFGHVFPNDSVYEGRKGGTAENGTRVPLIVNHPKKIIPTKIKGSGVYEGLVFVTDILPTLGEATGIDLNQYSTTDGLSFWQQAIGAEQKEHREYIHAWFNGNNKYTKQDKLLEFVFNKRYKRYAPSAEFPNGRLFDLKDDPFEKAGGIAIERKFGITLSRGLNTDSLTADQKKGYLYLGELLQQHSYLPVDSIKIHPYMEIFKVGKTVKLNHSIYPAKATRTNIVWESSDTSIASINKFGELSLHKAGKVEVYAYSWDDAYPNASGRGETYWKEGIQDKITLNVQK